MRQNRQHEGQQKAPIHARHRLLPAITRQLVPVHRSCFLGLWRQEKTRKA